MILKTGAQVERTLARDEVGLHLNPQSVIDIQDHTANEWLWSGTGSNSTLAAKNENSNYVASEFDVDGSPLPLALPCTTCVDPPIGFGWFVPFSGVEYDCYNTSTGYNCDPHLRISH